MMRPRGRGTLIGRDMPSTPVHDLLDREERADHIEAQHDELERGKQAKLAADALIADIRVAYNQARRLALIEAERLTQKTAILTRPPTTSRISDACLEAALASRRKAQAERIREAWRLHLQGMTLREVGAAMARHPVLVSRWICEARRQDPDADESLARRASIAASHPRRTKALVRPFEVAA